MQLIILPLTYSDVLEQKKAVRDVIGLMDKINDSGIQRQALAGLLVFADKIIETKDADEIKRSLVLSNECVA